MALDNNVRLAIQAKLKLGLSPKTVAEQLNVKLPTVYTINQKLKADKDNDSVAKLHAIPQAAIATVVEKAREEATTLPTPNKTVETREFVGQMEAVACGADGLKKLDMSFQTTVTTALERFNEFLKDEATPLKDIKLILDTTASAYEKVFTSGTNIHIGDNNSHSSQSLSIFKNKQGV